MHDRAGFCGGMRFFLVSLRQAANSVAFRWIPHQVRNDRG